jgi:hypothetical protein
MSTGTIRDFLVGPIGLWFVKNHSRLFQAITRALLFMCCRPRYRLRPTKNKHLSVRIGFMNGIIENINGFSETAHTVPNGQQNVFGVNKSRDHGVRDLNPSQHCSCTENLNNIVYTFTCLLSFYSIELMNLEST